MVYAAGLDEGLELVSPRQLLLFEAAGRLGYVTEAAAACGLSQPAATQALQQLQEHIALQLIERGTKGCVLTPWGAQFHRDIAQWLAKLRNVVGLPSSHDLWRISQKQLRAVAAIAQRGSVEQAAVMLGVTPRSVVRSVQNIERLGQLSLLQSGSSLTGQGIELAVEMEVLLGELRLALQRAKAAYARQDQRLSIAVMPDPGLAAIGNVVRDHLSRYPDSQLRIQEASPQELLTLLLTGEVDLLFGSSNLPRPEGIVWNVLHNAAYVVVGAKGHPLAGRTDIGLDELAAYQWVVAAEDTLRHNAFQAIFDGQVPPRVALICSAPPLAAQVLAQSDNLGLMTSYELAGRLDKLCAILPLGSDDVMELAVAHRTGWQANPEQADLIERARLYFAGQIAL
ncbi:LysR family transcriptional regulator [Novosphingobium umbonatum]|nr:LysR family transcriptional regulator [Novosphingobium umbonatum]